MMSHKASFILNRWCKNFEWTHIALGSGQVLSTCTGRNKTLPPSTSLPVIGQIASVKMASLCIYMSSYFEEWVNWCVEPSQALEIRSGLKEWVSWCLSPVNHNGLHQGWTQTSLYLQVIHFTSHQTTSGVGFFFLCLFRGHSTGEPASGRIPILFCRPTQKPCVSHSQHRENRERFWKNAGEWTGRVEISTEEISGSNRSMYGCILTYSRL